MSSSVPSSLTGLGMWSRILSSSTFRPTSGSDLWITVKSVLGSGMAFTSLRKVSGPDLRPQDGYPVVHLREHSGCFTCQHEDFSHQLLCRVIPAFVHLQVRVIPCLHMVSYRDALLQVLAIPLGNGSQHCGYMGLLHII